MNARDSRLGSLSENDCDSKGRETVHPLSNDGDGIVLCESKHTRAVRRTLEWPALACTCFPMEGRDKRCTFKAPWNHHHTRRFPAMIYRTFARQWMQTSRPNMGHSLSLQSGNNAREWGIKNRQQDQWLNVNGRCKPGIMIEIRSESGGDAMFGAEHLECRNV